jgi:ubiquinone/menaquinone biosynthesis C-methylase UbiE
LTIFKDKRNQEILDFWNNRARLAELAGSKDFVAKELEISTLIKYIQPRQKILEVGCGNGYTAVEFARRLAVDIYAIDFSPEMIKSARKLANENILKGKVRFEVADVRKLSSSEASFDLIYTERLLINLPDWRAQSKAIKDITACLKPGGCYLMCENSQNGLDQINELRATCGLDAITPPWHNRYLCDSEVAALNIEGLKLTEVNCYSSTYYFISRVVNAWLAAQENEEPKYDAKVNQLALLLPSIGEFGQGKLWIWEKQ